MYIIDPREHLEDGTRTKPFCLICHPKTASQASYQALRRKYNARVVKGQHYFDEAECERVAAEGGIVCSTVRNPWDLMISWYFYSEHDPKYNGKFPEIIPFKEWLPRILQAGNGWIERGLFYGTDLCNRIIRFEHDVEFQLNQCLTDCGLEPVELEVVAKTNHVHYSTYYDIPTAIAVERYCRREIEEWGYDFEYEVPDAESRED